MFPTGEAAPAPDPTPRRGLPPPLAHLFWEGILLLALVASIIVVQSRTSQLFAGPGLWWMFATIGLVATAFALSLRMRSPNLAVAGIAGMTGAVTAWLVNEAELAVGLALGLAVVFALLVGLVMGLVAGASTLPAWAVSLVGLALTQGVVVTLTDGFVALPVDQPLAGPGGWVALFLVLSLGGGVVLGIPAVRARLAVLRRDDARDGTADRVDAVRLLRSLLGFGGSSLIAALAGAATLARMRGVAPDQNLFVLLTAVAAVLVGGVAVSGRVAGFAGTVLGTGLISVTTVWLILDDLSAVSGNLRLERSAQIWIVTAMIMLGLGVGLLLEMVSRDQGQRPVSARPPVPAGGPGQFYQPPVAAPGTPGPWSPHPPAGPPPGPPASPGPLGPADAGSPPSGPEPSPPPGQPPADG